MATPKGLNIGSHKHVKINSGQSAGQDVFKFDLQLLLERGTLNKTWNKLMRSGVLGDLISSPTVSNINLGSPLGAFPCACCEGDCDTKCLTIPQSPTDTPTPEIVAKVVHSWTWSKDSSEPPFQEKDKRNLTSLKCHLKILLVAYCKFFFFFWAWKIHEILFISKSYSETMKSFKKAWKCSRIIFRNPKRISLLYLKIPNQFERIQRCCRISRYSKRILQESLPLSRKIHR